MQSTFSISFYLFVWIEGLFFVLTWECLTKESAPPDGVVVVVV
jgi:hypothetical protein